MKVEQKIEEMAAKVGESVRSYVRDRFTPGSLTELDVLQQFATTITKAAIKELHGTYNCNTCSKIIEVKHVNCSTCTVQGK